ncbi:spoIID/LytB domain protein [Synechococcus sp. MIT S9220]|nr:spoIID/LytB domain protein [Synechococcus sp. MIT S9220]
MRLLWCRLIEACHCRPRPGTPFSGCHSTIISVQELGPIDRLLN